MTTRVPLVFEVREDQWADVSSEPDRLEVTRTQREDPRHSRTDVWAMTLPELLDLYGVIGDHIINVDALSHVQVPDRASLVIRP